MAGLVRAASYAKRYQGAGISNFMRATESQIACIANCICADSSGESRSAKRELAVKLFYESEAEISKAIQEHPIEKRWDEYRVSPYHERIKFLLPE